MIAFRPTPTAAPGPASSAPPLPGIVDRMAETMRELAFAGRNVERGALFLEGYSVAEIDAHWAEAASLARQRAIRRVEADH